MHHHKNVILLTGLEAASVLNRAVLSGNKGTLIDSVGGTIKQ